ncbi:MAG: hypothetical protein PVJ33_03245 [Lysobacterales bacterium]|jgi:hypothetical protein
MSTREDKERQASTEERALDELGRRWSPGRPDEPPQLLDQAVLNAARREIERDGKRRGPNRYLGWFGALATAAVVVLAVTLVVRQEPSARQIPGPPLREQRQINPEHPPTPEMLEAPAPATSASGGREPEAPAQSRSAKRATLSAEAESSGSASPLRDEAAKEPGAADADATEPLPPREWIQRLLDLQASGESRQLHDELEAFRQSYPDYPLPPQLRNIEP